MRTTTNNAPKILQNCLPGVTIDDGSGRYHGPSGTSGHWSHSSYPLPPNTSYQQYSYHYPSIHGIKNLDSVQEEEEAELQRNLQRRHSRYRSWCFGVLFLITFILACNRADSKTDPVKVIQVLQDNDSNDDDGRGGGGKNDDGNHRQEILRVLEKLDEHLEGDIVLQSTKPKFMEAARVWRQGVVPPMAVIEAKTQQDVALAVPILAGLARDYQLEFAIRSGGYSPFASTTKGESVVLSLAHLKSMKLTNYSTVIMEPGVTVEDFQQEILDQSRYASIVADAARITMGGFVLGGGYGLLSRKRGLGMDNVIRLRVVLTNGLIRDVYQDDDLFWAVLGSGGTNFGVVTELEYRVYPSRDLKLVASVRLPLADAVDFLQKLGNIEGTLDRNLAVRVHGIQRSPDDSIAPPSALEKVIGNRTILPDSATFNGTTKITMYWMGYCNPDNPVGRTYIREQIEPLLPPKVLENLWFYYYSWSALSRAKEQPHTWSTIWAAQSWNGFMYSERNLPDVWSDIQKSFSVIFEYTQHVTPTIELWGGAIASTPNNRTAFPHRQSLYHVRLDLMIPNDNATTTAKAQKLYEQEAALVSAVWPSINKHLRGVFVNYPMPSLSTNEYPGEYWGDNVARLVELKQRFDPFHVLRYNQNVPFVLNHSSSFKGDDV